MKQRCKGDEIRERASLKLSDSQELVPGATLLPRGNASDGGTTEALGTQDGHPWKGQTVTEGVFAAGGSTRPAFKGICNVVLGR